MQLLWSDVSRSSLLEGDDCWILLLALIIDIDECFMGTSDRHQEIICPYSSPIREQLLVLFSQNKGNYGVNCCSLLADDSLSPQYYQAVA